MPERSERLIQWGLAGWNLLQQVENQILVDHERCQLNEE